MSDVMKCGCSWSRHPQWGDVLTECDRHAAGEPHEGSEPPNEEELRKLVGCLVQAGYDAVVMSDGEPE